MIPRPEFFDDALCAQMPSEMFFPGRGEKATDAKAVCARCDVRERCLEWALRWPEYADDNGVFGGTSPRQRRRIRAERREAA